MQHKLQCTLMQLSSFGRLPLTVSITGLLQPDLLVELYFYFVPAFGTLTYIHYSEGLQKPNWFELLFYLNFRNT